MKKIFLAIILVCAMLILTSCGSKEVKSPDTTNPDLEQPSTPAAETPAENTPEETAPVDTTEPPIVTTPGLPPSSKGLVEFYINTDDGLKREMLFLNQQQTYVITGKEYALRADFIGESNGQDKVIFSVDGVKKAPLGVKGELMIDGRLIYVKTIMVK